MQASHASTPSFYLLLSLSDVVQPPPTGREKGERFIAAFIARRVLAAVRIGLWRLLNFDVTKSLSRASIYTIRLARGVHAYLLGIIWEKEKSWQVGIRGNLELVSFFYPDFEKRYDIVEGGSEFRRWLRVQSLVLLELVE